MKNIKKVNRIRFILSMIFIVVANKLFAQQEVQISQYMINPMFVNPSASSMNDYWETNLSYRNQWNGLEGAPKTTYLSTQKPIGKPHFSRTHKGDFHNWHGVGAVLIQDQIGAFNNTKFLANYSYNLGLTKGKKYGYSHQDGLRLAFGVSAGYTTYNVDKNILGKSKSTNTFRVDNQNAINDPTYEWLDIDAASSLDMNFGFTLYFNEQFYLGMSSTQIFNGDTKVGQNSLLWRHYFINGSYKSQVNEAWYLIPSFMVKYVNGSPTSVDMSIQADWMDKLFFGTGYRHRDAVTFLAGTRIKWGEKIKSFKRDKHRYIIQLFYSYDLTVSSLAYEALSQNSKGSHEITIGFLLPPMFSERCPEDTWKGRNTNNLNKKH